MTISTINEVNQAIMFGNFTDEQLNAVLMAVKYRRQQLIAENKRELTIGAKVKFVARGRVVIGEVIKINRKFIHVKEQPQGNAIFATNWKVPGNMLEAI